MSHGIYKVIQSSISIYPHSTDNQLRNTKHHKQL